jgi:hypothetical protein
LRDPAFAKSRVAGTTAGFQPSLQFPISNFERGGTIVYNED